MESNQVICSLEEKHKCTVAEYFSDSTLFWEKVYDEESADIKGFYSYSMTKRKEIVLSLLDSYAGDLSLEVLDAGCGPGVVLEEVLNRGHYAVGVDISRNMVSEAKRRLARFYPKWVSCRTADIEDLPFQRDSFDAVLSLGVLMYLPSDHRALAEIRRVVKPGGTVLLVLPNLLRLNMLFDPYYLWRGMKYLWRRLFHDRSKADNSLAPMDFGTNRNFTNRRYLITSLRRLFRRHSFTGIKVVGVDFGPMTFWGKDLLPEQTAIALSERLGRLSGKTGFGWLRALAGQWVICMTKL